MTINKTKLTVCVAVFILIISGIAYGETECDVIAKNYLAFLGSSKTIVSTETIERNALNLAQPPIPIACLAKLQDGGYILVAASHSLTPVKAYSPDRPFEALPEPYRDFLLLEAEYNIRALAASKTPQAVSSENQQRWDFLLTFDKTRSPLAYTPDTYLLTTKWNQSSPYNKFLPQVDSQNTLAGCVNIAVAQVLKYYNYPVSGKGVDSYAWNGQQLKTILNRGFNWENMPDTLDAVTPEYKIDEVALLIRDLGIVNNTSFGLSNSSASIKTSGLIEHFGLSTTILKIGNADLTAFFNTLKGEIDAASPVLLEFPGHLTVADGYSSDPSGRKIHVNMGWGGYANDYYYLDQPEIKAGNYTFAPNLSIFYNVKPCTGNDCFTNLETGDAVSGNTISGKFDMTKDADKYHVYLKGDTSISASRGYSNVAFYVSLYSDSTNELIYTLDSNASAGSSISAGNLPAVRYTMRVSLCNDACTSSYGFGSNIAYSISFITDALSESEKAAIEGSLDNAPVIGNTFKDLILNASRTDPFKILIDARDENGDTVAITILNSNSDAVQTTLSKNILSITPVASAAKSSSKITVQATANGKTTEKSFIVMVSNEDALYGKSFAVNGLFENQDDFNTHKVILDGQCTITGDNGYSNQAFYASVKDISDSVIVAPADNTINHSFQRNIYFLGASLRNGNAYYTYNSGIHDAYTLIVSCPGADETITNIAVLLGIDLSGTVNHSEGYVLTVAKTGTGLGIVSSVPTGINCGSDCSENYTSVTSVTLDASPASGSTFTGWGGACAGSGTAATCTIIMDASKNVTAVFNALASSSVLNLTQGWNLISFSKTPPDTVEAVLADASSNIRIIWGYDNEHKIWQKWKPSEASNSLLSMGTGKGYWVYVNNTPCSINITGWTAPSSSPVPLYQGWNLTGYVSDDKDTSQALNILSGKWIIIWGWDAGQWSMKPADDLNTVISTPALTTLNMGKAYWIKMNEGTAWQQ